MLKIVSAVQLAGIRRALYAVFNAREIDDEAIDQPAFKEIELVEDQIARAGYYTDADKLAGLAILLEDSDGPVFADEFKVKLFERMRECAAT
jgi:hypothetical protein